MTASAGAKMKGVPGAAACTRHRVASASAVPRTVVARSPTGAERPIIGIGIAATGRPQSAVASQASVYGPSRTSGVSGHSRNENGRRRRTSSRPPNTTSRISRSQAASAGSAAESCTWRENRVKAPAQDRTLAPGGGSPPSALTIRQ